jgi:hypothetical protein
VNRRRDRTAEWRPFADLLSRDAADGERLRDRLGRLDLPAAERALLRELLDRE